MKATLKRIAVYGAGGFGREVRGMLDMRPAEFHFARFIDDFVKIESVEDFDDVLVAIADPSARKRIYENWSLQAVPFDYFIANDIKLHNSIDVGIGSILCPGVKLTVDVSIGNFVIINLNATVGHDVQIGNYSSLMPSVNISGNVSLGKGVFIGSGATILQGISIGDNAVIGAGSVVNRDVAPDSIVVGVPARMIKKKNK